MRLRAAEVVTEPYPHYYLQNVFPDEYYWSLLRNLPDGGVYQNLFDVTDLKLDHFRHRDQLELTAGWTETLPKEIKDFWDDFSKWFLGPDLGQAVLITFGEQLRDRFGDKAHWPSVSTEAELIRHRAGYFLGPHSDSNSKLAVLLFYLARDASAGHLGTSIYRAKDPDFGCPNSLHHSFDDFIKVKTTPYMPNSLLAFLRSDRSFHGVEPLSTEHVSTCGRDLIQYVLYDARARDAQLRERTLAATKGDRA
jgi:hypothetical protein